MIINQEEYRDYCLSKPGVTEGFPFDEKVLVFKVGGKIFSLVDIFEWDFVNLKCEPEYAVELRDQFEGIVPGYHMNKKLWNSVYLDSDVPRKLFLELVDQSYQLILESLPKSKRPI